MWVMGDGYLIKSSTYFVTLSGLITIPKRRADINMPYDTVRYLYNGSLRVDFHGSDNVEFYDSALQKGIFII